MLQGADSLESAYNLKAGPVCVFVSPQEPRNACVISPRQLAGEWQVGMGDDGAKEGIGQAGRILHFGFDGDAEHLNTRP